MGGDWRVLCFLVERMAMSEHCQAACDLLLCALNRFDLEKPRIDALEMDVDALAATLSDDRQLLTHRAIAALALGGGLAEGQQHNRPDCAFAIMAEQGYSSHVVTTCHAAWRASRNEMALLMPLIWQVWMAKDGHRVENDVMPPVTMIGAVPDYALDQFTRIGNAAYRSYLAADPTMRELLVAANVPSAQQAKAVADLMFLLDGSPVTRRAIWQVGNILRLPHRMLPWVVQLEQDVEPILDCVACQRRQIAMHRQQHFHRAIQIQAV